jgi:hypothetical protein
MAMEESTSTVQPVNPDLVWAVSEFVGSTRMSRIALLRAYYLGDQPLAFATDKFRSIFGRMLTSFADNLCESIVDAYTDRLEITGYTSNQAKTKEERIVVAPVGPADEADPEYVPHQSLTNPGGDQPQPLEGADADASTTVAPAPGTKILVTTDDPIAERAWNLWETNYGDIISDEVHREALITGDGFVIVWPDEDRHTTLWPQYSHEMAVRYHSNKRGCLEVAAKFWIQPDRRARMTLYYEDRVERFISKNKVHQLSVQSLTAKSFLPYADADGSHIVPNPYGVVPVFHFANKAYGTYGISILNNVIPLQDALNKSVCDMLVAMEFAAFRQRWVTGLEMELDEVTGKPKELPFDYGVDRIISAGDADTKFGEFSQNDLTQFLSVQRDFRAECARVVGIPLYYLYTGLDSAGDAPSGDALQQMEIRFTRTIKKMQTRFGKGWEETVEFALDVDEGVPDGLDLDVNWLPAAANSGNDLLNELLLKQSIGVPDQQLQKEAGYDDDQIRQFAIQAAADQPPILSPGTTVNPNNAPHTTPAETRSDPATAAKDKAVPPQHQKKPAPRG